MRRQLLWRVFLTACLTAAGLPTTRTAEAQQSGFAEPEVKAVFLFNFAQFVQWPDPAFENGRSPFVIGVLGDDPFGQALDDVVKGEMVNGRRIAVERYRRVEDVKVCHILFVGPSDAAQYGHILANLGGRPILTVGDTEGFVSSGGVIRFLSEQNHVRFRVNLDAAKAAGLTISSNLLRSADTAGGGR
jgi:hypothetical protein